MTLMARIIKRTEYVAHMRYATERVGPEVFRSIHWSFSPHLC